MVSIPLLHTTLRHLLRVPLRGANLAHCFHVNPVYCMIAQKEYYIVLLGSRARYFYGEQVGSGKHWFYSMTKSGIKGRSS